MALLLEAATLDAQDVMFYLALLTFATVIVLAMVVTKRLDELSELLAEIKNLLEKRQ